MQKTKSRNGSTIQTITIREAATRYGVNYSVLWLARNRKTLQSLDGRLIVNRDLRRFVRCHALPPPSLRNREWMAEPNTAYASRFIPDNLSLVKQYRERQGQN